MNLLIHLTPASYDTWKSDFDAHAEDRMQAGLTLLQLWRDLDGSGVTALFEVNDRAKADAWLSRQDGTGRFMKTA